MRKIVIVCMHFEPKLLTTTLNISRVCVCVYVVKHFVQPLVFKKVHTPFKKGRKNKIGKKIKLKMDKAKKNVN